MGAASGVYPEADNAGMVKLADTRDFAVATSEKE
jgi:hypothetical protein